MIDTAAAGAPYLVFGMILGFLNGENANCTKILSLDTVMNAPCRPRGCSEVRWRCELRRRANPEYYAQFGVML